MLFLATVLVMSVVGILGRHISSSFSTEGSEESENSGDFLASTPRESSQRERRTEEGAAVSVPFGFFRGKTGGDFSGENVDHAQRRPEEVMLESRNSLLRFAPHSSAQRHSAGDRHAWPVHP